MVFKIRVILDAKESVFRDIEIKEQQTLWNLHLGIKSAFNLQADELSCFYYSDDNWTQKEPVPLEDMSDEGDGEIMSDVYIKEAFPQVGAKLLYKFGFIDLWEFFCELLEVNPEKPAVNYPMTVFRFGKVPLKAPSSQGKAPAKAPVNFDDDDFDDFDEEYSEEEEYEDDDDFEDDSYEEADFPDDGED